MTEEQELQRLRFPVGEFIYPENLTGEEIETMIGTIENFPDVLESVVSTMSHDQLEIPYRKDGWNSRQVVHHCADSHMNAFIRFRLALTEEKPTIKPYLENKWAELPDAKMPVDVSLQLLKPLHARWSTLLRNLDDEDLHRSFIHPEHGREMTLEQALAMYDWHCRHHLAHITELKKRMGW